MKNLRVRRLLPVLAIPILLALYIENDLRLYIRVIPPPSVGTLREFLKWHPYDNRFFRHQTSGATFVEVFGSNGSLTSSGVSGYVFDSSGHLIQWTPDVGDDGPYQARWQEPRTRQAITEEEAISLTAAR
jgi:hypothetical protein